MKDYIDEYIDTKINRKREILDISINVQRKKWMFILIK